ncbi:MAG: hypothetical protein GF375_03510 [Candidatus Omnitrophica bacterium]|nr:hypothetical protein [Candidatus Omnitrophota bacterium]
MAPNKKTGQILARALELVEEVPYKVSLRWVFYALLQEGLYKTKKDYLKWKALSSRYRKSFAEGWHPDTLADDTRTKIYRTGGEASIDDCVNSLVDDIVDGINFSLDHFYRQDVYIEIWFEAKAMAGQFKYYTRGVDLVPFGGDPSIPFKWLISRDLIWKRKKYNKPITILYFGDYDKHGLEILDSAEADIRSWSGVDFELSRCGLTPEQIEQYNVPENPAKPGEFQWEALNDKAAKEIILSALEDNINLETIDVVRREAMEKEEYWRGKVEDALRDIASDEGIDP